MGERSMRCRCSAKVQPSRDARRRLYDDRDFAKRLGENARRFIADYFSDANFKKSVESFLARG